MVRLRKNECIETLTGTSSRMKSLPHADISSIEFHDPTPRSALFWIKGLNSQIPAMTEIPGRDKQTSRKCVYTYEDKYTFSRILTSDSLVFDSHFESGNLHSAFRIFPSESLSSFVDSTKQIYDLYMHPDVHTTGHTQWFYFSVSNTQIGREVVFNLRNFAKPDSMFNKGMRPLYLSSLSSKKIWQRGGTDIAYFGPLANNNMAEDAKKKRKKGQPAPGLYTMSFTHIFEKAGDTVYFAFCHPYTYTDLHHYLRQIEKKAIKTTAYMKAYRPSQPYHYMRRAQLCRTLAGNSCDILTITAPASSMAELTKRILAVVTCRVHPGETNSSWMMQGMLNFLTSDSTEAELLKKMYVFKIVPMLNPDGVINGNYRTSLSGSDLNRRWCKPDPIMHPTIYRTKEMIKRLKRVYPQCIVMDLHGHSTKEGIFIYGCIPDRKHLRPPSPRRTSSETDFGEMTGASVLHSQPSSKSIKPSKGIGTGINNMSDVAGAISDNNGASFAANLGDIGSEDVTTYPAYNMTVVGNGYIIDEGGMMNPVQKSPLLEPNPVSSEWLDGKRSNANAISAVPPPPPEPVASTAMKRDFLDWRVKLFPRTLATVSDMFLLEGCSFKVHRSKASTMRIVNFIELGIDCVYTIEASLAGLQPTHFGAHDLSRFGEHICKSLIEIYPAMAPDRKDLIVQHQPVVERLNDVGPTGLTMRQEFEKWKDFTSSFGQGLGVLLMSEAGIKEMTAAAIEGEGRDDDDSDIDDVEDSRAIEDKDTASKSSKSSKKDKTKKKSSDKDKDKDGTKDKTSKKSSDKDRVEDSAISIVTKPKKKSDKVGNVSSTAVSIGDSIPMNYNTIVADVNRASNTVSSKVSGSSTRSSKNEGQFELLSVSGNRPGSKSKKSQKKSPSKSSTERRATGIAKKLLDATYSSIEHRSGLVKAVEIYGGESLLNSMDNKKWHTNSAVAATVVDESSALQDLIVAQHTESILQPQVEISHAKIPSLGPGVDIGLGLGLCISSGVGMSDTEDNGTGNTSVIASAGAESIRGMARLPIGTSGGNGNGGSEYISTTLNSLGLSSLVPTSPTKAKKRYDSLGMELPTSHPFSSIKTGDVFDPVFLRGQSAPTADSSNSSNLSSRQYFGGGGDILSKDTDLLLDSKGRFERRMSLPRSMESNKSFFSSILDSRKAKISPKSLTNTRPPPPNMIGANPGGILDSFNLNINPSTNPNEM